MFSASRRKGGEGSRVALNKKQIYLSPKTGPERTWGQFRHSQYSHTDISLHSHAVCVHFMYYTYRHMKEVVFALMYMWN